MSKRSSEARADFTCRAAERMIAEPTNAEALLWTRLEPLGFVRQVPMSGYTKNGGEWNYILDFLRSSRRASGWLCVEVDGGVHSKQKGRDRRRDQRLATIGVDTIRVTNKEVLTNIEAVVSLITAKAGI